MSQNISPSQRPILLYHKIDPRWEVGITSITPKKFQQQLDSVVETKQMLVTMEDALAPDVPDNAIGLTFDDGYDSIRRHAFPLLQPHGFAGTVFLIADAIGKRNRWEAQLGWRSFRHLDYNQIFSLIFEGWRIGSHGLSHTALTILSDSEARREIVESKERLEQHFGQLVLSIAFPFGRCTQQHLEIALEAGYQWLCVPAVRPEWSAEVRNACVVRRAVYRGETMTMFRQKCSTESLTSIHRQKLLFVNKMSLGTIAVQRVRRFFT